MCELRQDRFMKVLFFLQKSLITKINKCNLQFTVNCADYINQASDITYGIFFTDNTYEGLKYSSNQFPTSFWLVWSTKSHKLMPHIVCDGENYIFYSFFWQRLYCTKNAKEGIHKKSRFFRQLIMEVPTYLVKIDQNTEEKFFPFFQFFSGNMNHRSKL